MTIREKDQRETKRRRVVRSRIRLVGTARRPRLTVSRTLKHIAGQLIDDTKGVTLVWAHDRELVNPPKNAVERAHALGALVAQKAVAQGISTAVFDRSGKRYHGRVKAVAEGARSGGLTL